MLAANHTADGEQTDYDLHGLIGIRLINPSPLDAATVARQLGPLRNRLSREPDIIIRFVHQLEISSPMRLIGLNDAGFADDAFFVLRSRHKTKAKVKVAFDQIGKQCEVVCESGLPSIPLLIPIVNLTALSKGAIPLHASAFTYDGTGVVVTGWSKGGKTETLLAFMANGAQYIGDEWVILTADGLHMYGIPEPIRVWDWHLEHLPQFRRLIRYSDRFRLQAIRLCQALYQRIPNTSRTGFGPATILRRAMLQLQRQLYVDIAPHRLFGEGACSLHGKPEKIFFAISHDSDEVIVSQTDPLEISRRMVHSLSYELTDFLAYYLMFRFAFPSRANDLIDNAARYQSDILSKALAGKDTYTVYHPYPVPLRQLYAAVRPFCSAQFSSEELVSSQIQAAEAESKTQEVSKGHWA